jgi:DHA3 family macrolide efflux protein-like MFS transporter
MLASSPYWPVLRHPVLRRVLPGLVVSALGDGMSVVAVSWLALQLAPTGQGGAWVAVANAAYTLPSLAGTFLFGRWLVGRGGAQLAGWDATLRAVALGAIPLAYAMGVLGPGLFVALLAVSALLRSWGSAGRFTLIAEVLPVDRHLPGNALISIITEVGTIGGPALAGLLIAVGSPAWVIAFDAATFAVLASTYRWAVPGAGRPNAERARASRSAGFAAIRRDPRLLGLLALSFGFFSLFAPIYVALPVHIADDLHAPASLLGWYFMTFSIGTVAGGLVTGHLRRWSLWPTVLVTVLVVGVALLPLGLGAPGWLALAGFAVAGFVWAPYMPTAMALFQRTAEPAALPQVLAANSAVLVVSMPLGTAAGGLLVSAVGARSTMLVVAVGTIVLGLAALLLRTTKRRRVRPADPAPFGASEVTTPESC